MPIDGDESDREQASAQSSPARQHLYDLFRETADTVRRYIPINRAVLVMVGRHYRDLVAIAGWHEGTESEGPRLLAVRLPALESLFARVAAQRCGFSDDYFGLFSGNSIERRLLLGGITDGSYSISPLRDATSIAGLIGFSSELPQAFGELEAIDPDRTFAPLTAEVARLRAEEFA